MKTFYQSLAEMSNKLFSGLKKKGYFTENQLKYFSYGYRKVTNFGKLYFLPKARKRLHNVLEQPVISNCDTLTENALNFKTIT